MSDCVAPPTDPLLCQRLHETDQAIKWLEQIERSTTSEPQGQFDKMGEVWKKEAEAARFQVMQDQAYKGGPTYAQRREAAIDLTLLAVLGLAVLLFFLRRPISLVADRLLIGGLAAGIRSWRYASVTTSRIKERAIAEADRHPKT